MSRRVRIGISGSYGGLNVGDEAILQSILTQLRRSIDAEVTVFTRNAADTRDRHGVEAVVIRDLTKDEAREIVGSLDLFVLGELLSVVDRLWDLIRAATEAGELDLRREDLLFFGTPHPNEVSVNSTRVTRVLGTDVWDLTYAEWEGRRQLRQIADFLRKRVPGFDESYVAQSGVQVGVRKTRRITGEYRLTAADLLTARKFADVVARGSYPVDIHNPAGKGTLLQRIPDGEAYDIPLRALLPQRVPRVIVAGRCISGTHEAHSSYRVMPIAMATGHAAGIAAATAVKQGTVPRDIPAAEIQEELRRQGANLGTQTERIGKR